MRVAVLGIGILGRAVAERLQAAGHTVMAYNRTRETAEPLQSLGIELARSPAHALQRTDCALLFLADAPAIRSSILSAESRPALKERTVVQMGTIGPDESREIQQAVEAEGGDYLEAPVLGSVAEATAGTLLAMVGGTDTQLRRVQSVLHSLSKEPRLVGPVGHAATMKLALNQLIAAETAAFSLSLGLVERSNISTDLFMALLKQSALFAPTFEKKLPRLLQRDYERPNFSTRHLLKDVDLVLREAQLKGLETAGLEGVRKILVEAVAHGRRDEDYSALYEEVNPPREEAPVRGREGSR
jgi:3-hydroxyisobutyrate dehydrogenase